MGADHVAILGHRLRQADLEPFRQRLDAEGFPDTEPLRAAFRAAGREIRAWPSRPYRLHGSFAEYRSDPLRQFEERGFIEIEGTIRFLFGRAACEADLPIRFALFLEDPGVRQAMRRVFFGLAERLGSPYALYIPDSSSTAARAFGRCEDGSSLDEIRDFLRTEVGPSELDPRAPGSQADVRDVGAWCEDDFADFRP